MENNIEIINDNLSNDEYVKSLSTTYDVNVDTGLTSDQAKVRLAKYGKNELKNDNTHS
jgi:hypothetical protein